MQKRDLVLRVAWAAWGLPYRWGGDDPMAGFDCSGFVIECLKSAGALPAAGDWTAELLFNKFEIYLDTGIPGQIQPADLVFWKNKYGRIIHVEIMLDDEFSIGAGGGGSGTISVADAIDQNAYIRVRPINSRPGIAGFANPWRQR